MTNTILFTKPLGEINKPCGMKELKDKWTIMAGAEGRIDGFFHIPHILLKEGLVKTGGLVWTDDVNRDRNQLKRMEKVSTCALLF